MSDTQYKDLVRGRRKSLRRQFHYSAKLVGRNTEWNAFIVDISDSGAQLEVLNPYDLPDEFSLMIGGEATVERVCRVVWRSVDRVGVRFLRQPQRLPTARNANLGPRQPRKSNA